MQNKTVIPLHIYVIMLPLNMSNEVNANQMKTFIESEAKKLIGKTFFDCRYDDFYTVVSCDKSENWLNLNYTKRGLQREATSFVTYHIDAKQHLPKIIS